MNIIFDESKAQNDIKLYRKKERFNNLFVLILIILFFIDIFLLVLYLLKTPQIDIISLFLSFVLAFIFIIILLKDEIINLELSAAATYSIMTENNSLLDIVFESGCCNTIEVKLILESNSGDIERIKLCDAIYIENTQIIEETFDINKEIIYIPYNKESIVD